MNFNLEEKLLKSYIDRKRNNVRISRLLMERQWTLNEKFLCEMAFLIGKITGDGNLDSNFTTRFIGQNEDLLVLKNLIISNFAIPSKKFSLYKRNWWNGTSYLLQINDSLFGRLLFVFDAPAGNKLTSSVKVHDWIKNSSSEIKRHYLQGLLEDELSTIKIRKSNYVGSVILKMSKNESFIYNLNDFLKDVKNIIEEFGIECSKISGPILENIKENDENTYSMYFHIKQNKANILRFKERIGFRINKNKIVELNKCCKILKQTL